VIKSFIFYIKIISAEISNLERYLPFVHHCDFFYNLLYHSLGDKTWVIFGTYIETYLTLRIVLIGPQVHISERLSALELIYHSFVICRKDTSMIWKVLVLYIDYFLPRLPNNVGLFWCIHNININIYGYCLSIYYLICVLLHCKLSPHYSILSFMPSMWYV
jgi:hypothetical protein